MLNLLKPYKIIGLKLWEKINDIPDNEEENELISLKDYERGFNE